MKLQYQSAFSDYRPYADVEVVSWTRANGDAAQLGGHMGQMKHDAMPAMVPLSNHPPAARDITRAWVARPGCGHAMKVLR